MKLHATLFAFALAVPALHAAPVMTQDDVKANLVRIEEQYDTAQARCKRVQGHARELCNEQARGERDVEVAQLQFRADPTADNDQKVRLAKADAAYSKSLIECKEMDGRSRAICRKDAKMVYEEAKTDAKLQRQVMEPVLRSEAVVRERTAEADRIAQAQYTAARQRCEALPPEGRINCFDDVKKRFPDRF